MVEYNKDKLVQFVRDNKQLILNLNFDGLYTKFVSKGDTYLSRQKLTLFLVDAGANPLYYCNKVNTAMFREVELPDLFKELKFKDSVKSIGSNAFYNCEGLELIDLNNVESIGYGAFHGCKRLTSIDLKNVTSIDNWAFAHCTGFTSIDFKNVKSIGEYAFWCCTGLTSIDFKNVESIGANAFYNGRVLASIDLKNVKSIGIGAFEGCTCLKTVYAPKDLDLSIADLPADCKIIRR